MSRPIFAPAPAPTPAPPLATDLASAGDGPQARLCVRLNGQPVQLPQGSSLAALLAQCAAELDPGHCATAVNGGFVPRAARPATPLRDGDAITTFQAIVGG